ncbi:MAG: cytochrome c5 family protein [Betaproteobacteria bacterium]|nr:cytochrome c5 family protein [Betaproteobacteria bacterium]NCX43885.1 cytochrome c5 family protein [Betaproteobacteria bacterium]NDA31048.1 cytochrome c5 family protein [Betaproteobacteria bacterium]NDA54971.1 cytochrome c5 family protein [Betaproteobacteria bacterium]NDB12063.1 cytochrome c5 family protein [Betaproteobacteria bacterium]
MSDAQSEEHGAFIKTPGQLITVVVLAFVVPIFIIVLLSGYVGIGTKTGAGTDPRDPQLIEARVAPVAKLEIKNLANKVAASGETVYKAQCAGCHAVGAAGAPKIGDAVAWAPRIKTGFEALWQSSLKGKGAMGAQAGGDYDDQEIGNAVVYLANAAGAKFAELKPAPKAEGGAQADAAKADMQANAPSAAKANVDAKK